MPIGHLRTTRLPITVESYVKQFGPKLDAKAEPRVRPSVTCLACDSDMHTIGEAGPLRDAVWGHNPTGAWCPVKENAAKPYELLSPTEPDEVYGEQLRASFFLNWKKHWAVINEVIQHCEIHTFIAFIERCDRISFWCQADLEEWFIPYIFMATCDFPPPSSKAKAIRRTWVRCCFDGRVRGTQDLWIRTTGDWRFLRAVYRSPLRSEPTARDLISLEEIVTSPNFLLIGREYSNVYQQNKMKAAFPDDVS